MNEQEIREKLIEAIDDRRFDSDYKGGLHAGNAYVVDVLLPFITEYGNQREQEARIDELEKLQHTSFEKIEGDDGVDAFLDDTIGEYIEDRIANLSPTKEKRQG